MPTQVTYFRPGHHSLGGVSFLLPVHSQITLVTLAAVNASWMARHAAMNVAGVTWPEPHGYQVPFISCPKLRATGPPNALIASAYDARNELSWPAAIAATSPFSHGCSWITGSAPPCMTWQATVGSNGWSKPV